MNNSNLKNLAKFQTAIVLINYNSIEDTIECIKSIRNSTKELPFIVVVDNASNDASFLNDRLNFYPHLHIIINEQNIGFGKANNMAIDWLFIHIDCDFTFILNNDTIVTKGLIDILKEALINSDIYTALTTPRIMVYSNKSEVWYGGGDIDFNKMAPVINKAFQECDGIAHITNFASGCAMFFRTKALRNLGGYDPFYFMYDEDVELSIRLTKNGYKILYVQDAILYHKCQGSQIKKQLIDLPYNQLHPRHPALIFYLKNTIKNRRYTLRKHLKHKRLIVYLSFYTYWFAKSFQYLLYGNVKASITTIHNLLRKINYNSQIILS